ncbi:hypothetical protein BN874_2180004 [Candidatus Contendobacter odensis Run_B_J11]|uniref:Uncharacterized protein n=1 Tax=Candidatus Contendobacter odensis Run_B_J11 TaxID=1400861 RepID=A0A7U7J2M6_9GAMM|nr:hypothetical protein BN874_2180004 [Candidatus Contendobacter odensis Run_B_J11]
MRRHFHVDRRKVEDLTLFVRRYFYPTERRTTLLAALYRINFNPIRMLTPR